MDSSYASGSSHSPFSPPAKLEKRRRRPSTPSSQNYESDDSYNSRVKYGRYGGDHVSNWDSCRLESYGIFYDGKATELSELYKTAFKDLYLVAVKGLKEHAELWTKLLELKAILIESTKTCLHNLDVDEEFSRMNLIKSMALTEETEKCMDAMNKIKEEIAIRMGPLDNISRHIFCIWHAGIVEYVQYYSDLIKDLSSDRRLGVEGEFCQLLTFFCKIFLLNPTRGDAMRKVKLKLNGVETTSVPDLRFSLQGECSAEERGLSFMTVAVGEVKMWSLVHEEKTASEFNIRNLKFKGQSVDKLLGQHGGELLVESTKSALQNTNLGIICVKTMIIFTCLDMDTEHLSCLQGGSSVDDEKSNVHYSKPFNFLVRKDREEIMDTLFHLGLLCRIKSLHFFNN